MPDWTAKLPVPPLDQTDKRILELLQQDSSRPMKSLASLVGLSRSAVQGRIARLQATGVIKRFTIETAAPASGPRAMLSIRLARTPDPAAVCAITALSNIIRCYSMSGETDLIAEISGQDIAEINAARDAIALTQGVAEVRTSFILHRDKDPCDCGASQGR